MVLCSQRPGICASLKPRPGCPPHRRTNVPCHPEKAAGGGFVVQGILGSKHMGGREVCGRTPRVPSVPEPGHGAGVAATFAQQSCRGHLGSGWRTAHLRLLPGPQAGDRAHHQACGKSAGQGPSPHASVPSAGWTVRLFEDVPEERCRGGPWETRRASQRDRRPEHGRGAGTATAQGASRRLQGREPWPRVDGSPRGQPRHGRRRGTQRPPRLPVFPRRRHQALMPSPCAAGLFGKRVFAEVLR